MRTATPILDAVARRLDGGRVAVLRGGTAFAAGRYLLRDRAARLFCGGLAACVLALAAAVSWPLWLLALGPAIYGVPHLLANARYLPRALLGGDGRAWRLGFVAVVAAMAAVAALRLDLVGAVPRQFSEWQAGSGPELAAAVIGILLWALARRAPLPSVLGALVLFAPVACGLTVAPLATAGALILLHNFTGFYFWIAAARPGRERAAAVGILALVLAVHAALFAGLLDGLGVLAGGFPEALRVAGLDSEAIGRSILPGAVDTRLFGRAIVAYGFGQSVHYFVWLKAIPEQHLARPVPVTFRQSLGLMVRELGPFGARLAVGLALAGAVVWLMGRFDQMRYVYFAVAGLHGFAELAGMACDLSRRVWEPAA